MGKASKRKLLNKKDDNEIDLPKKHLKSINVTQKKLIVILEGAQLETVKVGNGFELLNSDDHINLMRKKQITSLRPDITHQSLLMLMDSPLNRAGFLQVYIHTEKNVLIEISSHTRIPRTFKRFAGLMVQILHKFQIQAAESKYKLLKVIKNPITNHLPIGCKKYAMSFSGNLVQNCKELVPKEDEPIVYCIGAFAHGNLNLNYTEGSFSISNFPLSAAITCSKLCCAFEEAWKVI